MRGWDKITLYKFQQVEAINAKDLPDLDKVLFSTCAVFDYTEYELDNLPLRKVNKLAAEVTKIFSTPFEPKPFSRVGRYFIDYEVSKVTLGQYIELAFFLQAPVKNAHYVFATLTEREEEHQAKAEYFLQQPITKIMGGLSLVIERLGAFNREFKNLFGLDKEVSGEAETDPFNKQYGWTYSVTQVAEYERITLEEAYGLPARRAFNDLAYLKALAKYQAEQIKKQ